MSKILALDSSTDACSVALTINGKILHLFELAAKSHTQRLLPMVDQILSEANCSLTELDAIAYGRGPGSFTGLRICMGVVQGLAFGANLPVIPVSTLQAMARNFADENPGNKLPIMPALDARMDEIYWGLFDAKGEPEEGATEYVMAPIAVCDHERVRQLNKNFIAIGPGWHYAGLQPVASAEMILDTYPHAKDIAVLAIEAFKLDKQMSIMDAQPVYLRDSVSWKKRQRIRTNSLNI